MLASIFWKLLKPLNHLLYLVFFRQSSPHHFSVPKL